MNILPIEEAFQKICSEKSEYLELYHIYFATKFILQKHYYPFIKDANPYFTDHGIGHINRILNRLYSLLEDHLKINPETTPYPNASAREAKGSKLLNAYELYLLLCSVLWHDMGNLYGRIDHEKKINIFFDKAKNFLHDENSSEWILKIAEAHSGTKTIDKIDFEIKHDRGLAYFPRFLAALLRFSDELDEDKERIGGRLYGSVPSEQEIFWFFCKSNDSIHLEDEGDFKIRKIVIESKIVKSDLFRKFKKKKNEVVEEVIGIEEFCKRIDKINEERKYCSQYVNKAHYFKMPEKIELILCVYEPDLKTCLEKFYFVYDNENGYKEFLCNNDTALSKYRG